MKIFAIMLVKNEADIVGYVLKEAEKWADKIFIIDNGSTDGTWEIIKSMKNEIITPWKQDFGPFRRGMRADVFNEFRHLSTKEDWWCYALDADEFYIENPRDFLQRIPKRFQWVSKKSIDYVLTKEDLKEYDFSGNFEEDKKYIKYLKPTCWSEGRFFSYRKNIQWDNGIASQYPMNIGIMAPEKILVKHYQYRSPQQIEKRIKDRAATKKRTDVSAWNRMPETIEDSLFTRNECIFDENNIEFYKKLKVVDKMKKNIIKDFLKLILIKLKLY